jgi:cobalt/nickel transport system permease protein
MHLRHADIDECAYGNAWRERHASEKLLLAGGMLALAIGLPPFPAALLIAGGMAVFSLCAARIPWRVYLRVMIVPAGFALISAAAVMVSLTSDLRLEVAPRGAQEATRILARSLAAVSCLSFLMLSTPVEEIVSLLRRLGMPAAIAEVMLATHRFISIFAETAQTMWQAQTARCGYATRRRAWRSVSLLAASLFVHSLDRARRMETALAARGYEGETIWLEPQRKASAASLCAIAGAELAVVVVSIGGPWR